MAGPKTKYGRSETFQALNKKSDELGEHNDCVIITVSLVCNVSYTEAHMACAQAGRKKGQRMAIADWKRVIDGFGYRMVQIDKRSKISQYPSTASLLKNITTHQPERFPDVWKDGKTYIFRSNGHVTAVIDGRNHDWSVGRSLRAIAVYEIVKK